MTRPGSYNLLKLVVLVILLIAVFGTTAFTYPYDPREPCPDGCDSWFMFWGKPLYQSKYCGYTGDYVLWFCHNGEQNFNAQCYYNNYLPITFR